MGAFMLSISTACIFSGDILSIPDNTPLDTCEGGRRGGEGKKAQCIIERTGSSPKISHENRSCVTRIEG